MGRKDRPGYIDPRIQKAKDKYEGLILPTRDGKLMYEIEQYNHSSDVVIHFIGTDYRVHRSAQEVLNNQIANPFPSEREGAIGAVHFEDLYKKWVGCQFKSSQGYLMQIIDYVDSDKVTVKFLDDFGYITTTKLCHIKSGSVANPYHPSPLGGYSGEVPEYIMNHPLYNIARQKWQNMLKRGTEYSAFRRMDYQNVYDNTCIAKEWYCFTTFAEWYLDQMSRINPNIEYDLDKDLKYFMYKTETNDMRCYGPNYCVLLPHDLNCVIPTTMASDSVHKRKTVKKLADKYLAINAISAETYDLIFMVLDYYTVN